MAWEVRLSSRAERALGAVPSRDQRRIKTTLLEMQQDPQAGDTRPLQGRHHEAYRRRVGAWRIIFSLKPDIQTVLVADIRRRTSTTY